MKLEDLTTIDQLDAFLSGTQAVAFSLIDDKDACYRWIQRELVRFRYLTQPPVAGRNTSEADFCSDLHLFRSMKALWA